MPQLFKLHKALFMKTLPYYFFKARALVLLPAFLLLISCNKNTQTVNVDNRYTLEVPADFKQVNDLNKEASLQYQNTLKELYVIVIDEPKTAFTAAINDNGLSDTYSNTLEGYSKLITDGMDSSIAVKKMPDFIDKTIHELKARELSFEGLSSGNQVYWKLAFIEGNNRYYQIMVWTLADNHNKHEKKMQAIVDSFTETDKSKN